MKRTVLTALALFGFSAFSAQAADFALVNTEGKGAGTVTVEQAGKDLLVRVMAEGLTPGWHGIHIHGKGDCSDHKAFKSAGGHAARKGEEHGFMSGSMVHMGDLPNIWAGADGKAGAEYRDINMQLSELQDEDGSALVIHAKEDDYKSQPAGDAGDRVACAVIAPAQKK